MKSTWFSLGVLLFRLLSGERPFPSDNSQMLKRHTEQLRYSVNGEDWVNVSENAKDLVRKLLINKEERLTAEQALTHPWFREAGATVLRAEHSTAAPRKASRSKAFVRVRPFAIHESVSHASFTCISRSRQAELLPLDSLVDTGRKKTWKWRWLPLYRPVYTRRKWLSARLREMLVMLA